MSDMNGTKSKFIANFAKKNNLSYLIFDFRGHGNSSGDFINYGIIDWVLDLKKITTFLKIPKFILIGSSMGGWVAMYFALNHPKRVEKLIGISPAPDFTENLIMKELNKIQRDKINNNIVIKKKVSNNFYYYYSPKLFINSSTALICKIKKKFNNEVVFFHGGKDNIVPYDYNNIFIKKLNFSNLKIIIIKHADHSMSDNESLKTIVKSI